jgi:ABC-type sugar transport system permease subunit
MTMARLGVSLWPYLLVAPVVLALILVIYVPIGKSFLTSLTDSNLLNPLSGRSVGLTNYSNLLQSNDYWNAGLHTLIWAIVSTIGSVVLGVAAAILTWRLRGGAVFRGLLLVPWLIPPVVTAYIWQYVLQSPGPINSLLTTLHLLSGPVDFLASTSTVLGVPVPLWTVIQVGVWTGFPFILLTSTAGLATIPPDIYEAASLDGASAAPAFRLITLPLLAPVLETGIILQLLFRFGGIDIPFLLTKGGPGDLTNIFGVYIYNTGLSVFNLGVASAMGFVLFVLILPLAAAYVIRARRQLQELV